MSAYEEDDCSWQEIADHCALRFQGRCAVCGEHFIFDRCDLVNLRGKEDFMTDLCLIHRSPLQREKYWQVNGEWFIDRARRVQAEQGGVVAVIPGVVIDDPLCP